MLFLNRKKKRRLPSSRGFTLVELLITVAIVVLATGAVLTRQAGFTETTLLKSQALETALDIRAAQQYGINVRAGSGSTRFAYGVYFDPETMPERYIVFLDSDDDLLYDPGEEISQQYYLDPRFQIYQVCIDNGSGGFGCNTTRKASVAFKRPNFDAEIRNTNPAGTAATYGDHNRVAMQVIIAPADDPTVTRAITIYNTGQITVQ